MGKTRYKITAHWEFDAELTGLADLYRILDGLSDFVKEPKIEVQVEPQKFLTFNRYPRIPLPGDADNG